MQNRKDIKSRPTLFRSAKKQKTKKKTYATSWTRWAECTYMDDSALSQLVLQPKTVDI